MRLAFYEDRAASQFHPLTLTRPVFELVCGHFSQRERIVRLGLATAWGAFVREYLASAYQEEFPEARVNDFDWLAAGETVVLNGRWLIDDWDFARLTDREALYCGDTLVALRITPDEALAFGMRDFDVTLLQLAQLRERIDVGGTVLARPWDLVELNAAQIRRDFDRRGFAGTPLPEVGPQVALLGAPHAIHIARGVQLDPFVVIDARKGPVSLDAGCWVLPFTRIEGPCHVGRETHLFRAHLRAGTTIGPVCRIGGEVEASIVHGYANKYHDGFLGHSYLGAWVNLGAATNNSDLKNDYSAVRVPLEGVAVDTGLPKVGCFVGDHSKTAIGCSFNTGTSVGAMCLVLPAGELLPKHIPSFTNVWHGQLGPGLELEAQLETARVVMQRRQVELTRTTAHLYRRLFQLTRREREDAVARNHHKRSGDRRSPVSDSLAHPVRPPRD